MLKHIIWGVVFILLCLVFLWFQQPGLPFEPSASRQEQVEDQNLRIDVGASDQREPSRTAVQTQRIKGSLSAPLGGKPVAPVDFFWDFACEPNSAGLVQGKFTVSNHGVLGDIQLHMNGSEGFSLLSAATFVVSQIATGESREISIEGRTGPPGKRGKLVIIAKHQVHETERVRVISIVFDRQRAAPMPLAEGTSIISGDQGEKILLQPATRH